MSKRKWSGRKKAKHNILEGLRFLKVPIDDLRPDPNNPRTHDDRNLESIRSSVETFQQRTPLVVNRKNKNLIEKGNGTYMICKALGWTHIAAVFVEDDPSTETGYKIADNRTAELAGWDAPVLNDLMVNLDDIDIAVTGFEMEEVGELLKEQAPPIVVTEDEPPPVPKKAYSKKGDLWILGKHRVLCGDSTKKKDVERLMDGKKADCMITDPSYGVDYEGGSGNKKKRKKIEGDTSPELYHRFLPLWVISPSYIWFAGIHGKDVYSAVDSAGMTVRSLIIWNKIKPHYGAYMSQYLHKHEPCLYCVKGKAAWYGPSNEVSVWDIEQPHRNEYHPSQKPIECMVRPMNNSTKRGDIVVDPFLGSGTTLMGAEQLDRICYGIDIEPGCVDVIVMRWQQLTGKKPKLRRNGKEKCVDMLRTK